MTLHCSNQYEKHSHFSCGVRQQIFSICVLIFLADKAFNVFRETKFGTFIGLAPDASEDFTNSLVNALITTSKTENLMNCESKPGELAELLRMIKWTNPVEHARVLANLALSLSKDATVSDEVFRELDVLKNDINPEVMKQVIRTIANLAANSMELLQKFF